MGTISKALDLLGFFSEDRTEIGLGAFVKLTGRDKATLHRHLTELQAAGFVEQHAVSRAYRLGPAIVRLAALREAVFPFGRLLQPIVTQLSEAVGELAHASLLQGDALTPIVHADPRLHGVQVHFDRSEILPFHATSSGLAALAFVQPDQRERVLSRPLSIHTGQTIVDPVRVRSRLEHIRACGVSAVAGGFDEEVSSLGAPVFGQDNRVVGAIAIAAPTVRAKASRMADMAEKLVGAAGNASRSLGGIHPDFEDYTRPLLAQFADQPAPIVSEDRP